MLEEMGADRVSAPARGGHCLLGDRVRDCLGQLSGLVLNPRVIPGDWRLTLRLASERSCQVLGDRDFPLRSSD